jgi:hypothetical protein
MDPYSMTLEGLRKKIVEVLEEQCRI